MCMVNIICFFPISKHKFETIIIISIKQFFPKYFVQYLVCYTAKVISLVMHHPLTHSCTLLYFLPPSPSDLALNRNCLFGKLNFYHIIQLISVVN